MKPICKECGKKQFPTKMHAEIRILSIERKADCPLYSYECEHCGKWHMTKKPNFESLILQNLTKPQ